MADFGKIILVNGASSSGKSTLCAALQEALPSAFLRLSVDHLRESGALPLPRYRAGDFVWSADRSAFFGGFHRSLVGWASAGNNLLVEHIIETEAWLASLSQLLAPFDVFTVLLHCPLSELEAREQARSDKGRPEARRDFESIYRFAISDLELDGTAQPEENVSLLLEAWRDRRGRSVLAEYAEREK